MRRRDDTRSAYGFARLLFRQPRKGLLLLSRPWNVLKFKVQGARLGQHARIEGKVYLRLEAGACFEAGDRLHLTGGLAVNRIGRNLASCLAAGPGAVLRIGDGVGISASCIWAMDRIEIGNHVNIGADCVIMDHDAHSLDAAHRRAYATDRLHIATAPVVIGDDVLLGARCTVLKGVTVGVGSVVGAGSVVTRDIPAGEVWAGNPARFIRKI